MNPHFNGTVLPVNSAEREEIWRAAQIMIDNYGKNAAREAAHWVEWAAALENSDGERAWTQISQAINILLEKAGRA